MLILYNYSLYNYLIFKHKRLDIFYLNYLYVIIILLHILMFKLHIMTLCNT